MKRYSYLIALLLFATTGFAQSHFNVVWFGFGNDHMNIYVIDAKIGEISLEAGDEIAVFDGAICCGIFTLAQPIVTSDNNTFASVIVSKKDDGFSNGYTVGNPITYKFWDSSKNTEISGITAEYFQKNGQVTGEPTFTPDATAIVKLSAAAADNQIPSANAGPDQTVNEGDVVTLDGTASSDQDSDPITYTWTAPAGITLSSKTTEKPTFTAPEVSADTEYLFLLVVNDGISDSPADEVKVTVLNIDHAPYVKSPIKNILVDKILPDEIIDLTSVFADDDLGDVLTYSLTSNENDQIVKATIAGSNLTLSFSSENTGSSEIVITASSNGKVVELKFKVEVNIPTQINPLSDDTSVQIYPNPTKGLVKIEFSRVPVSGSRIIVNDITGKIVHNSIAVDKVESLNMKGSPQGMYFIKIDQKVPKTYKLVVLE